MPTTSASVPSPSTTACFSTARRSAPRSSRSRAAFSKSSSAAAAAISFSSRRISGSALPAMKSQKSIDDLAVFLGGDLTGARGRALADVAEQARPADLLRPPEHPGRAGPGREHPQQHVQRFPDRPGVGVRPEVPDALAVRAAHHLQPRVLLAEGDGEFRVGLVVPVPHVEPRVELLDPVVFQLQRLDLGGHHRPLDAGRAGHHLRGPRVQRTEVGEVRVQPLPQALGLADVDDPVAGIAEAVDAGRVRNRARGGAVESGIRHIGEGNPQRRQSGPIGRRAAGECITTRPGPDQSVIMTTAVEPTPAASPG